MAQRRLSAVRLRVPGSPELRGTDAVIHWLKQPGDVIGSNETVAVLGARSELRAPENTGGEIDKLLAAEGERVINRQPLLRISVQRTARPGPRGLEEPSSAQFLGELPSRMVMEPVDRRTHRTLAIVGGIAAVGLAIAAVCVPVFLIVGGPTPPAIGGFALMIVAAGLAYAQHVLRQPDG